MPRDILLTKGPERFDISFENGDFKITEGLDTAIIMSLFTDARADASEIAEPSLRRGWLGNELNDDPNQILGSKLWLLEQARVTQNTLNRAIGFVDECFQWMINRNIAKEINVSGSIIGNDKIKIDIIFVRFDNTILNVQFNLWENTLIFK